MVTFPEELQTLIDSAEEDELLEFKEARNHFDLEKLLAYCSAIANEGGGKLILGVTDKIPRRTVGTQAFKDLNHIKLRLVEELKILRVEALEYHNIEGRVVVFHIPSRPKGVPIDHKGTYWMRAGESLKPMTQDMLKRIFEEVESDYSKEICSGAVMDHLDPEAIENFRTRWLRKSNNQDLANLSVPQLLLDAELITEEGITYAALILLGTSKALQKFLPQSEIVFEYRSDEAPGPAQQRINYRQGFLVYFDDLWKTVSFRNDLQHFQDGFVVLDVPTFHEGPVREAILNAVAHRNYRSQGSVFVRQFPRKIEIESPGGFPQEINLENMLWKQSSRNRRIAEIFEKCGLVERAGQGLNLIFKETIKNSKPLPDFSRTDAYQVFLTLHGQIQDLNFLRFLEKIGQERLMSFVLEDFLILDLVQREEMIPARLQSFARKLLEEGIVEKYGHARGVKYLLSRRYYDFIGKKGSYTRKLGLDRETNKKLLLKHFQINAPAGSRLKELAQVLPALTNDQVKKLLQELKAEQLIHSSGMARGALWYATGIVPTSDS
ncbi:MAG: putative DNA binding domain-containing protein [Chlamydiae bacterium]|nr:putative DNA binding domain-containing protein [Chlamydiota bacterium]